MGTLRLAFVGAIFASCGGTTMMEPLPVTGGDPMMNPPIPSDCAASGSAKLCPVDVATGALTGLSTTEQIKLGSSTLATFAKFADQGRGKVACQYRAAEPSGIICATDIQNADWSVVGARFVSFAAPTFQPQEKIVGHEYHSSWLAGDFNRDGYPDFFGFSEAEEGMRENYARLYLGTADPLDFTDAQPFKIDHPAKGGVVIDDDGDGCEDVLVLGTGFEDWTNNVFTYYPDYLYRGDCKGNFHLANAEAGLDQIADFAGANDTNYLGRYATATDFNADGCADLVVGNYRAFPNNYLLNDCRGHYTSLPGNPDDVVKDYYGHTVGLFPSDVGHTGKLDLFVVNLWHNDDRGAVTDESALLHFNDGGFTSEKLGYYLEAPFGSVVADLDSDGTEELLMATAHRWENYEGHAAVLRDNKVVFKDTTDWIKFRETPVAVDFNFDGQLDLVADGRVVGHAEDHSQHFLGIILSKSVGALKVTVADGTRSQARMVLSDGRGQPSNMFTIGLGTDFHPTTLTIKGSTVDLTFAIGSLPVDRYFRIDL